MSRPTLTEQLAEWAVSFCPTDLPPQTTGAAVECVIDTLGCVLAGSTTPVAQAVRLGVTRRGGAGLATVVGMGGRAPAPAAALSNATAAHSLELDDTDLAGFCHAGAVVVPAAIAVAEEQGASGSELVAAVAVGYEVALRLARWLNPTHRLQGFHTTATVTTLGAAAAAARLAGMDARQTASALGVAASFSGGTFEFLADGANLKRVHAGKAAHGGLLAVELVADGVEGPLTVLEGEAGLARALAVGMDEPLLLEDLGSRFVIEEVGRKPYPCCRFCHSAIDAALELRGGPLGFAQLADLSGVWVSASRLCVDQTGLTTPTNELERQFSTPYGVALALLRGAVTLADFRDRPDPEALSLAARIEMRADATLSVGDRAATVGVVDRAGRSHTATTLLPLGEPSRPMSPEALAEKFRDLATTVLTPTLATTLQEELERLPELTDLSGISAALSAVTS